VRKLPPAVAAPRLSLESSDASALMRGLSPEL
jgi:hypothetical protein